MDDDNFSSSSDSSSSDSWSDSRDSDAGSADARDSGVSFGDTRDSGPGFSDSGGGDSYTEVTTDSWFSRLGNAIKGIVIGLIILVIGFPLLFWNEGRAVETYKALKEGAGLVITVPADKVDPKNEGKLVHLTGLATTEETLTDSDFGIFANAIKLKRQAKMYQWKENKKSETEKNVGGSTTTRTTYTYEKVWSDSLIKSGDFKKPGHGNPGEMAYPSKQFTANKVTLGAFQLSGGLIGQIGGGETLAMEGSKPVPERLQGKARWNGNTLYIGRNPNSPEIGDTRVEFQVVKPQTVSVIAKQSQSNLESYRTSGGKGIERLEAGTHSAEAMFTHAKQENTIITWILRVVGFLCFFIGIAMILKPLSVVLDVLPFLGNVAEAGIGLVAFVVALGLTLVTVAIAWFVYRPLLAVVLIVAAVGLFIGYKKMRAKAPAPQPAR